MLNRLQCSVNIILYALENKETPLTFFIAVGLTEIIISPMSIYISIYIFSFFSMYIFYLDIIPDQLIEIFLILPNIPVYLISVLWTEFRCFLILCCYKKSYNKQLWAYVISYLYRKFMRVNHQNLDWEINAGPVL